jgi:hypothetical protein
MADLDWVVVVLRVVGFLIKLYEIITRWRNSEKQKQKPEKCLKLSKPMREPKPDATK